MHLPWNLEKILIFAFEQLVGLREKYLVIFLSDAHLHRVYIYSLTVAIILNN